MQQAVEAVAARAEAQTDEDRRAALKRRLDDERAKEAAKAKRKRPGLL